MKVSYETAQENYLLLKGLPEHVKLCVHPKTGKLTVEDRWLSSARRFWNQNSRHCLLEPLRLTFSLTYDQDDFQTVVSRLRTILEVTYANDSKFLKDLFQMLQQVVLESKTYSSGRINQVASVYPETVRRRVAIQPGDIVIDFEGVPSEDCTDYEYDEDDKCEPVGCYSIYDWIKQIAHQ